MAATAAATTATAGAKVTVYKTITKFEFEEGAFQEGAVVDGGTCYFGGRAIPLSEWAPATTATATAGAKITVYETINKFEFQEGAFQEGAVAEITVYKTINKFEFQEGAFQKGAVVDGGTCYFGGRAIPLSEWAPATTATATAGAKITVYETINKFEFQEGAFQEGAVVDGGTCYFGGRAIPLSERAPDRETRAP